MHCKTQKRDIKTISDHVPPGFLLIFTRPRRLCRLAGEIAACNRQTLQYILSENIDHVGRKYKPSAAEKDTSMTFIVLQGKTRFRMLPDLLWYYPQEQQRHGIIMANVLKVRKILVQPYVRESERAQKYSLQKSKWRTMAVCA